MITRANYESWFVDYLEGNLPESQIDQFLDFLNQNPDLKEELHLFEEVALPPENVVFPEKQQLRKSLTDETHRLENKAIACMEGDLDEDEKKSFEAYITGQPELQKEYNLLSKTKLIPDLSVRFQHKHKLYRKPVKTIVLNWVARAAAVVVLVWGINSLLETQNKTETAQNKTATTETSAKVNQTEIQEATGTRNEPFIQESKKLAEAVKPPLKAKPVTKQNRVKTEEKPQLKPEQTENEPALAALPTIDARLENREELNLATARTNNITPVNEAKHIMRVDEFLAMRAKKAGKEGLFSAQHIARLGLNIASELSGERIGYKEKDGKITSVEFESKLMAFSIPLKKN